MKRIETDQVMTGDDQTMMIDDDRITASGINSNADETESMTISDDQRWRQKVLQATVSSPGSCSD